MNEKTLYITLDQSVLVPSRKVTVGDVATIFCIDNDISYDIKKTELFTFTDNEQAMAVVTILKLISIINIKYKDIKIESIGCPETVVYYKNPKPVSKMAGKIKAFILMIFTFLGTAYSIMAYNGDVEADKLLANLYEMFTGNPASDNITSYLGIIFYSIGLAVGMIVFFNHGLSKNSDYDPTPLQIQMRLYEQDVNTCIITDSERNQTKPKKKVNYYDVD